MGDLLRILAGFVVGFVAVYTLLKREEKTEENRLEDMEIPPFEGSERSFEIFKKFSQMKQKV
ncbi:MAG: hypothetical protein GXN94_01945 [Aquificae bacterium]|nr:hypothetical protein [Aquificota bacterium]